VNLKKALNKVRLQYLEKEVEAILEEMKAE